MLYMHVTQHATVEVIDHRSALWRIHGGPGSLIGSVVVTTPITPAQRRRLPKDLRARLAVGVPD